MRRRSPSMTKAILSKSIFFALVMLLLFFSYSLIREVKRRQAIKNDIQNLEQELVALDQSNSELQSLIDYLKTDEYAELEAKRKLGLKRTDEQVILVTEDEALQAALAAEPVERTPNWLSWKQYFFK